MTEAYVGDQRAWQHFSSMHVDQDARGCRPTCVGALHGRDGRVLTPDAIASARAAVPFLVEEPLVPAEEGAAA